MFLSLDGAANYGCRIVPIKITRGHQGEASSYDIARAMLYATALGARAMNLSFAGSGPSRLERTAMHWALTWRRCEIGVRPIFAETVLPYHSMKGALISKILSQSRQTTCATCVDAPARLAR